MQTSRAIGLLAAFALLVATGCESGGDSQTTAETESATEQNDNVQRAQPMKGPESLDVDWTPDHRIDTGDVPSVDSRLELSEKEWRRRLTDEEFEILRNEGTEPSGAGDLLDEKREGVYYCAGCGAPLFSSKTKYESNTGWPSFFAPYNPDRLGTKTDRSMGMARTEVHCARCGGHLGHVFDDGPEPTGQRYCINSAALDFKSTDQIQSKTEHQSDDD